MLPRAVLLPVAGGLLCQALLRAGDVCRRILQRLIETVKSANHRDECALPHKPGILLQGLPGAAGRRVRILSIRCSRNTFGLHDRGHLRCRVSHRSAEPRMKWKHYRRLAAWNEASGNCAESHGCPKQEGACKHLPQRLRQVHARHCQAAAMPHNSCTIISCQCPP